MALAMLLNFLARPGHDAIARQNLGSIKEMHYQHHGSALTGGAFLLGRWFNPHTPAATPQSLCSNGYGQLVLRSWKCFSEKAFSDLPPV